MQTISSSAPQGIPTKNLGTSLGEKLQAMLSVKAFHKGHKRIECERGIGGKNFPRMLDSGAGSCAGCP
eukprot:CCRYP_006962-RA/>CCRYP_006962-RA protein AED:0.00 eAED:0.00 QI:82/1/1/1/0/0/2/48/67